MVLTVCGKVDSHHYSRHYSKCYWCERVATLGVDIFPGVAGTAKIPSQTRQPSPPPQVPSQYRKQTVSSSHSTNRSRSQARYFIEDLGNGVILDMVYVPYGIFMMGSPEGEGYDWEEPQHKVKVNLSAIVDLVVRSRLLFPPELQDLQQFLVIVFLNRDRYST